MPNIYILVEIHDLISSDNFSTTSWPKIIQILLNGAHLDAEFRTANVTDVVSAPSRGPMAGGVYVNGAKVELSMNSEASKLQD